MPIQTVDQTITSEARRLTAALLSHLDQTGGCLRGGQVKTLAAYKTAKWKTDAIEFAQRRGWLEIEPVRVENTNVFMHQYWATETARAALALPDPLPPVRYDEQGLPFAFPDDACEEAIYSFHYYFHQQHRRWPIGAERSRAFTGSATRRIPRELRTKAYENLVRDRRLIEIRIKSTGREVSCYVIPTESPEYADKHGWTFYAKSIPT